jgi:RimJ/RimL family protein N-acetyltransferase
VEPRPLRTDRLLLRLWRESDRAPFAEMNADPRVMEHMPALLTREQSDAMVARITQSFTDHRLGLWAVEIPGVAPFAGYVGLSIPSFDAPFTPCVEVGWRLARACWGAGYAAEAARAAIRDGFERLGLAEIVSFTVLANARSWRVMERLGMRRSAADDFDHPRLPPGHTLARHVLYRLGRAEWLAANAARR